MSGVGAGIHTFESELLAIGRQFQIQILARRTNRPSDRTGSVSPHYLRHWRRLTLVGKNPIAGNGEICEMCEGNKLDIISDRNRITAETEPIRIKRLRKQTPIANDEQMPRWRKSGLGVTVDETLTPS